MNKLLEVENLRVSYKVSEGDIMPVRGIDFYLNKGETLAIVGESGCGKSVTAKAIMGLIEPANGIIGQDSKIIFKGKNILDFNEREWRKYRGAECSMIFQDALVSLNPTMTIGNQIAETLILHSGMKKKQAMNEALNMLKVVGISNPEKRINQYPHELSGGMSQRVMIAIALACRPKLLIADEPTTALDVTIQAQIIELIKKTQKEFNTSIIIITHDLGIVADIADRILVMYCGEIVEAGSCIDIFYNYKHPYTWSLLNSIPRLDLKNKQRLVSIEGTPPNINVKLKGCKFASRCKFCMNICKERKPPLYEFGNSHNSACWLHHPKACKNDLPFKVGGEL
ncbi:ABC transporter ATP-binding protein [Paraclostridium bifermentans]|uniref:ABC transporter ATP-binding protein n=1 Tax=Paraclostridium bifermentans TaxID=1490 RepID=UPI003D2D7861